LINIFCRFQFYKRPKGATDKGRYALSARRARQIRLTERLADSRRRRVRPTDKTIHPKIGLRNTFQIKINKWF